MVEAHDKEMNNIRAAVRRGSVGTVKQRLIEGHVNEVTKEDLEFLEKESEKPGERVEYATSDYDNPIILGVKYPVPFGSYYDIKNLLREYKHPLFSTPLNFKTRVTLTSSFQVDSTESAYDRAFEKKLCDEFDANKKDRENIKKLLISVLKLDMKDNIDENIFVFTYKNSDKKDCIDINCSLQDAKSLAKFRELIKHLADKQIKGKFETKDSSKKLTFIGNDKFPTPNKITLKISPERLIDIMQQFQKDDLSRGTSLTPNPPMAPTPTPLKFG